MSNFTVLFDACVLYPAPLRDFLMHLTLTGLFRAKWTNHIHDEWMRKLLENRPDLNREKLERTKSLMNKVADDCLVEGYESLIGNISLPDLNDRHVLAAAIRCGASVIVTTNLSDFPNDYLRQYDVVAQHPDIFISHLINLNYTLVCEAARRQRSFLKNPPKTISEYLQTLELMQLVLTANTLRKYAMLL